MNRRKYFNPFVWATTQKSTAEKFWFGVIAVVFVVGVWGILKAWNNAVLMQQQVETAQRLIEEATSANEQLRSNLQNVSPQFVLESTARLHLNKKKSGEEVVVIPREQESDLKQTVISDPSPALWWQWIFPKENEDFQKGGNFAAQ